MSRQNLSAEALNLALGGQPLQIHTQSHVQHNGYDDDVHVETDDGMLDLVDKDDEENLDEVVHQLKDGEVMEEEIGTGLAKDHHRSNHIPIGPHGLSLGHHHDHHTVSHLHPHHDPSIPVDMSAIPGMAIHHAHHPHPNLLPSFPMILTTANGQTMSVMSQQPILTQRGLTQQQIQLLAVPQGHIHMHVGAAPSQHTLMSGGSSGADQHHYMDHHQSQSGESDDDDNSSDNHHVGLGIATASSAVQGTNGSNSSSNGSSNNSSSNGSGSGNSSNGMSGKPRKSRWRPSEDQKAILESYWQLNAYPESSTKQAIVKQFSGTVTYQQVTSWFKHKRENDQARGKFTYRFQPAAKFTPEQVEVLENAFMGDPYAKSKTLTEVADQLGGVDIKRVQNWFKHKRSRLAQQGKFEYKLSKPRVTLEPEQITFLRGAFFTNPSPSLEICEAIAAELNLKSDQVNRWFSNERSRRRKRASSSSSSSNGGSTTNISGSNNNSGNNNNNNGNQISLMDPSSSVLYQMSNNNNSDNNNNNGKSSKSQKPKKKKSKKDHNNSNKNTNEDNNNNNHNTNNDNSIEEDPSNNEDDDDHHHVLIGNHHMEHLNHEVDTEHEVDDEDDEVVNHEHINHHSHHHHINHINHHNHTHEEDENDHNINHHHIDHHHHINHINHINHHIHHESEELEDHDSLSHSLHHYHSAFTNNEVEEHHHHHHHDLSPLEDDVVPSSDAELSLDVARSLLSAETHTEDVSHSHLDEDDHQTRQFFGNGT